jgi:hypothetical protein
MPLRPIDNAEVAFCARAECLKSLFLIRHEGKPFKELHGWLITLGGILLLFAVCTSFLSSFSAAGVLKDTQP